MSYIGNTLLHIVEEKENLLISKKLVYNVPRIGDELRLGGMLAEKFYKVIQVLWVYDEPESPYERVNIGVIPSN